MRNYYGWIRAERISPPVASRLLAYAAVALYEGLASVSPELRSLAGQLNGLESLPGPEAGKRYDPVLVALAAERTVLDSLFAEGLPATRAAIAQLSDSLEAARISRGISRAEQANSEELGRRLAAAILAWADKDGFKETRDKPYRPPQGPQFWVNDARADEYSPQNLTAVSEFVALDNPAAALRPGEASERALALTRPKSPDVSTLKAVNPAGATEPWWGSLRPFVLREVGECSVELPARFSPSPGSAFYREAFMSRDPQCFPTWWVDGTRVASFHENTPIRDVYGIEIYRGPGEVPGEFAGSDAACGVIVIWTKSRPYR
jgi:hypothetical protein